jgi:hypothetical protein
MSGAWTHTEQQEVIELYDQMHRFATGGVEYNKAAMIRHARGESELPDGTKFAGLKDRSKGSIEMKLMNITAACEALDRPDLSMAEFGYRPMVNMQKSLKDAVEMWLAFEPVRKAA